MHPFSTHVHEPIQKEIIVNRIVLIGLISLIVGCGGGSPTPSTTLLPQITGAWKADSGPEIFDSLGDWNAKFLQFTDKGNGKAFVSQDSSNLKACLPVVYALFNANVISISSKNLINNGAGSFNFELPDANTLKLIDENGNTQTYKKTTAVPPESQCESVTSSATLEDLPVSTNRSDTALMGDGTNLRVSNGTGSAQVITLPTGALGASQVMGTALGQFTYGVVMQAGDYWAVCHCGNDSSINRWNPGVAAAVDTVDTQADLGKQTSLSGVAFDGTFLWLTGYNYNQAQYLLLKVNAAVEPDVLVEATPLKFRAQGLTFHNGKLWALVTAFGTSLVQLDSTTGKATRVVGLPAEKLGTSYRSLVSQGGKIFVMRYKSGNSLSIDTFQP